jgi:hypothetical protein
VLYCRIDRRSLSIVHILGCGPAGLRFAAAAIFALVGLGAAQAQQPYSADEVKAAFLYHFGTYVEWPIVAAEPSDTVTIAILGAAGVAEELRDFLPGRTIHGRRVELRLLARIQDLRDDEMLFIGKENNARLSDLIDVVGSRPTLIVTDATDGLADGAMVNFQVVDQRVRFEVSLRKAEDSGLMLSSRLLSAALRVVTSSCRDWECGQMFPAPIPGFAARFPDLTSELLLAVRPMTSPWTSTVGRRPGRAGLSAEN